MRRGISDVLQALPPQASAEALLIAAAQRIREARPDEEVRAGWFLAPVGESAGAWVHLTALEDDSIAGEEIRIGMEGVGGVWRVVLVESSTHCRRGVDAGQPALRLARSVRTGVRIGYNAGPWRRPDGRGRIGRKAASEESPSSIEQARG